MPPDHTPLISTAVLTSRINPQHTSPLLNHLPLEVLHRILLHSTNGATDISTRLFLSLSCKLLALTLANASGTKSTFTRLTANKKAILREGARPLLRRDVPRAIRGGHVATAVINARMKFMEKLQGWLTEEEGWRLCAICGVFKRLDGGMGAEEESWNRLKGMMEKKNKKMKKGGGRDEDERAGDKKDVWLWVCPKHRFERADMVRLGEK